MLKKIPVFLLLAVLSFAKDKPVEDPKPIFTPDDRAPVLILQRDAFIAQADSLPKQIYAEQAGRRAHDAWLKLLKDKAVDLAKWNCNELSFECTPIPQPKPEEVKQPAPPEKK